MDGAAITAQYTTQEKLLLSQAIYKLGAVQWPVISQMLIDHPCCAGRSGELFSPEACEAAYVNLMAAAGMNVYVRLTTSFIDGVRLIPAEDGTTPQSKTHLHLAQTFYFARMAELKSNIADCEARFVTLMDEIQRIKAGELDEAIVVELRAGLAKKYGKKVLDTWVPVKEQVKDAAAGQGANGQQVTGTDETAKNEDAQGEKDASRNAEADGSAETASRAVVLGDHDMSEDHVSESKSRPTLIDVAAATSPQTTLQPTASPAKPLSAREKRSSRRDAAETPAAAAAEESTDVNAATVADSPAVATATEVPERPSSRNTRRATRGDSTAVPTTPAPAPASAGVAGRKGLRGKDAQIQETDSKEEEERMVEASIFPDADVEEPKEDVAGSGDKATEDGEGKEAEREKEVAVERPAPKTRKSARTEGKAAEAAEQAGIPEPTEATDAVVDEQVGTTKVDASEDLTDDNKVDKEGGDTEAGDAAEEKPTRSTRRSGRPSDPAPATPAPPTSAKTTFDESEEPAPPPKKKMGRPRKYPRPDDIAVEASTSAPAGEKGSNKDEEKEVEADEEAAEAKEDPQTAMSGIEITIDPPTKKRGRPSNKAIAEAKAAAEAEADVEAEAAADEETEAGKGDGDAEQDESAAESRPSRRRKSNHLAIDTDKGEQNEGLSRRGARGRSRGDTSAATVPEQDDTRLSPVKASARPTGRNKSPAFTSVSMSASGSAMSADAASPLSDLSDLETPGDEEGDQGEEQSEKGSRAAQAPTAPKRRGRPPRKAKAEVEAEALQAGDAKANEEEEDEEEADVPDTAASTRSSKRKAGRPPSGAPSAKSKRTGKTGDRDRRRRARAETQSEASGEEADDAEEAADDAGEEQVDEKASRVSPKAKSGRGRKRKVRDASEEKDDEGEEEEEGEGEGEGEDGDEGAAETVDEAESDEDEDEDVEEEEEEDEEEDETETEPEVSTTRRGTRRSLPSSSLNPARGGRRDSAIGKGTRRDSPAGTSPAASTSRRGGSVLSSSYRDPTSARDREKDEDKDEERMKPRRGRPPKKREPSASPVKEPARSHKKAKQEKEKDRDDEDEDKDEKSNAGGRASRRTKGLPADDAEEEKEETERAKERDKRGKRASLRMSSARRDTDEPSPGPGTGASSSRRASGHHHKAGSVSSMTPGPDADDALPSASTAGPSAGRRRSTDQQVAAIIARAQQDYEASEAGGETTPRPRDNSKEGKAMRTMLLGLLENIAAHRNGSVFEKPVRKSDAPDYFDVVKRPMDLKTVRQRIKDGQIANIDEFRRDVQLIFAYVLIPLAFPAVARSGVMRGLRDRRKAHSAEQRYQELKRSNAMIYNRKGDQMYKMAAEMLEQAEHQILQCETTQNDLARRRGGGR